VPVTRARIEAERGTVPASNRTRVTPGVTPSDDAAHGDWVATDRTDSNREGA